MTPNEPAPRLRRVIVTCLAAITLVPVVGCSSDTRIEPPRASSTAASARELHGQQTIAGLASALTAGDADRAASLGTGAGREQLRAMVENADSLGLEDLELRFVDDGALDVESAESLGPDAWRAVVEVRYRAAGWDARAIKVETPFAFVPDGDGGQVVAAIGGKGGRTPLWMRGRVEVREAGRARVVVRAGAPAEYLALTRRALVDVARVLPGWKGRLVLEVPASEEELDQALDATQEQYANIAAVTAAVDGSLVPGSPVHVFLNPRVFDRLGPRGSQVVISHETTHVATNATFSDMPTWLLEGFADYVALAHAGIPVRTAAAQILTRVRRDGPPDHLPNAAELAPTAEGLGATYEEAWLANRFLAQEYGEAALVRFYRTVDGGESETDAFRTILGTTEAAFVRAWSRDLDALAGGDAG